MLRFPRLPVLRLELYRNVIDAKPFVNRLFKGIEEGMLVAIAVNDRVGGERE
jgi:hypothetical protein